MIKNKLKWLLSELKKFKVQAVLVLDYMKKIIEKSSIQVLNYSSHSDIDEAFKSMHQSFMTKLRNYACEDWTVLNIIIKYSITIFDY